ncbi:MAG: type II secretion system protein GspG [Nitrospirae bacterium]|nr:type II secretion system protein GspG [Nitrospirota bacterium]
MKDPFLAVLLALLLPGLGHLYLGAWGRGFAFLLGSVLPGLLLRPVGLVGSVAVWIWSVVDAYRLARARREAAPPSATVVDGHALETHRLALSAYLPFVVVPIGIIALLVAVGAFFMGRRSMRVDEDPASAAGRVIERIEAYHAEHGAYPETLDEVSPTDDPIERKRALDAWGRPLVYRKTESGFSLFSAGPDAQPDTTDDILYHPSVAPAP